MFSATAGQNIFMFLIKENIVSDVTNKAAFEFVIYFQAKKTCLPGELHYSSCFHDAATWYP